MDAKDKLEGKRGGNETAVSARVRQETRCYTLTGIARELDQAERILQHLEQEGGTKEPILLLFILDGRQRGVTLRTLATWEEE